MITYQEDTLVSCGNPVKPGRSNNLHCWWCCHPFEGKAFVLPRRLHHPTNSYYVYGNFCSPPCAKAYLLGEGPNPLRGKRIAWFRDLLCRYYDIPISKHINSAPPRHFLEIFGGQKTISQFREATVSSSYQTLQPPLIPIRLAAVRSTSKTKRPRLPPAKRKPQVSSPLRNFASQTMTRRRGKPTPNHRSTLVSMLQPASSPCPPFSPP